MLYYNIYQLENRFSMWIIVVKERIRKFKVQFKVQLLHFELHFEFFTTGQVEIIGEDLR